MPYTKLSDSGVSSLLLSGDRIYTGSEKGVLVSRGKTYGKQNWKIRLGAKISDITPAGRGILVSSLDNFIYFISKDNGKILWKRRFADRLLFKPVIVKDLILISPYSSTDVTFLDTNTGKIVNRVFLPEGNYITGNSIYINEYLYIQMLREVSAFSMEGCAAE
jgi:outer membrane protein assembly factor BamB